MIDIDIPLPPKWWHDPITDWQTCNICDALLRAAMNEMADTPLAPMGPLALIDWIRATTRLKYDAIVRVGL